jgi:hypothetical protein
MTTTQLSGYRVEETGRGWVACLDEPKLAVRADSPEEALDGLRELAALVFRLAAGGLSEGAESANA